MKKQKDIPIGGGRSYFSLAYDRFLYELIARISRKSALDSSSLGPLCSSTTDLITHRLIATGSFERLQIEGLDHLFQLPGVIPGLCIDSSGIFVDVGANIGIFTVRYAKYFAGSLAVEANPITYRILQANLQLRQIAHALPVCVGASNVDQLGFIRVDTNGMLGWSSFENESLLKSRDSFTVDTRVRRLDDIVGDSFSNLPVSVMKIDIEGHELAALEGAKEIIRNYKPLIMYEKNGAGKEDLCAAFLRKFGYDRFVVFKGQRSSFWPGGQSEIVACDVNPDDCGPAALILSFADLRT